MSTEKLVEALGKRIDRRDFLVKVGKGIIGGLLGLMGLPQSASALYRYACCNLCQAPSNCSCSGSTECVVLDML